MERDQALVGQRVDKLLARDKDGALRKIMMDTLDGDFQAFKAKPNLKSINGNISSSIPPPKRL